jgi:hypothetical protein
MAACGQHPDLTTGREQLGDQRRTLDNHVLTVVQHQQQLPVLEELREPRRRISGVMQA